MNQSRCCPPYLWLDDPGVGETSWAFKNTFIVTEEQLAAPCADLVFEGLDTFAIIELVSSQLALSKASHSMTGFRTNMK